MFSVRVVGAYGPACYRPGGCADVLIDIAATIDARRFNSGFPKAFPRFIASAIWRYCAEPGLDICNGNQIDDRGRCTNMWCQLYSRCDRVVLAPSRKQPKNKAFSAVLGFYYRLCAIDFAAIDK